MNIPVTQATSALSDVTSPEEVLPTFDVLPLSAATRRAVDKMGYTHPTPVQRAVFEPAAAGRDLVVQARTGTGKTAAFGLPIVDRLVQVEESTTQILILSPTRELALQINRQIEQLSEGSSLRTVAIYGGAAMQPQVDALQKGAQVVVGTPGRVLDHLERGTLSVKNLRTFILDESDEMLSMGFLPQITAIWERLSENVQTLLFSATVPPAVRRIAESRLKNPEFITLSGDHIGALSIDHFVYTSRGDKAAELAQVIEIENPDSAIIFCNTKEQTKRIAAALQKEGFAADWLNADLSQSDREKVMLKTREGHLRFLVATDVAARGIDISHLTHVINADFPESTENYVHRTGRTGRAGKTGRAISLIAPQDIGNLYMLRLTYKIFPVSRELPTARELQTRKEADLIQFFLDAFPRSSLLPSDWSLAQRMLASENALQIVAGLLRNHLGAHPSTAEEATDGRRKRTLEAESSLPKEKKEKKKDKEKDKKQKKKKSLREEEPRERREEELPLEQELTVESQVDEAPRRAVREESPRRNSRSRAGAERRASAVQPVESNERSELEVSSAEEPWAGLEVVSASSLLAQDQTSSARVFVSVGRRDGVHREDLSELLEEHGLDAEEDIHFIKIRENHSFVGVSEDLLERTLDALQGATLLGRTLRAEKAREHRN